MCRTYTRTHSPLCTAKTYQRLCRCCHRTIKPNHRHTRQHPTQETCKCACDTRKTPTHMRVTSRVMQRIVTCRRLQPCTLHKTLTHTITHLLVGRLPQGSLTAILTVPGPGGGGALAANRAAAAATSDSNCATLAASALCLCRSSSAARAASSAAACSS
jgi:hypothetical protein